MPPLLSNLLLTELDRKLERRGHRFCRYADDCNIYVRSKQAKERVMASVTRFLEDRLKLRVNPAKSAADRPWRRSFLEYSVVASSDAVTSSCEEPGAASVATARVAAARPWPLAVSHPQGPDTDPTGLGGVRRITG